MSKVKVFTLAKKYGYKSAEFVDILRNIGFPVSSYQASVEEWDVPVIEERLIKGGLLKTEESAPAAKKAKKKKEDSAAGGTAPTLSFADLQAMVQTSGATEEEEAPAEAAPEPEPEPTPQEEVAEHPSEAPAEPEPAAEEPAEPVAEAAPEEPVAQEEPPASEPPVVEEEPQAVAEPEAPVAQPEAASETKPEEEQPADEAPAAPAAEEAPPQPKPAAAKPAAKKPEAAEGTPTPTPRPKPKRGANKVGKIDLAALGLIKSQHQEKRRSSTFSDIRDRVASNRRDQRQREREKLRARRQGKVGPKKINTVARKKDVVLDSPVNVKAFSTATGVPMNDIVRKLMRLGVMATANATIDADTVELLADELDINVQYREEADIEAELMADIMASRKAVDDSTLKPRDPVIAFLGHVDHGKTTLVDAIRETRLAGKESGGITQHIGAYKAELPSKQSVTILDTPGHEAFTAMRARGAHTTDICILVVAADDGVMPQTEEAAAHAKAAGTPIIVAINKIDAPGANPESVKAELAKIDLQPEDWGGSTGVVEVSALRKQGIDALLERVMLEAELLDLKAHAKGEAMGTVMEASLEQGRGKMVTVLVQDGTLKTKDVVLAGHTYGKVRLMFDHNGKAIKEAGPSTPVEISGLEELPPVGEKFYVVKDAKAAKAVSDKRILHKTELERANKSKVSMSNIFEKIDESQAKRVRLVVKADVQGSLEVLKQTLEQMTTDEVIIDIVHSGVGGVSETDVMLAQTAEGIVVAFHVAPDGKAKRTAEKEGVEIRRYEVIYDLVEDIEKAIEGLLAPDTIEEVCGHAVVLEVFRSSRFGTIAGVKVETGFIKRNCKVRLIRDGKPIYTAPLASLRRFKDDVREVNAGDECGLKIENYEDIKAGDELEIIEVIEKARTLEEVQAGAAADQD
ncbi:MAG: translation initiation factor IF-2 [Planctomycetes bacterium]|nr:translation initiation factor IF-2 [Planctomycetota bacterium]